VVGIVGCCFDVVVGCSLLVIGCNLLVVDCWWECVGCCLVHKCWQVVKGVGCL